MPASTATSIAAAATTVRLVMIITSVRFPVAVVRKENLLLRLDCGLIKIVRDRLQRRTHMLIVDVDLAPVRLLHFLQR